MAKKKQEQPEVQAESSVVEISKQGVAVYKPGMHPRQLRVAAEEAAKQVVSDQTDDEEVSDEDESEAPVEE